MVLMALVLGKAKNPRNPMQRKSRVVKKLELFLQRAANIDVTILNSEQRKTHNISSGSFESKSRIVGVG
jgi:hypothetical protein